MAFIVLWVICIDACCLLFVVNVDEWLKSANSLSPNDMEAGEIFVLLNIQSQFVWHLDVKTI